MPVSNLTIAVDIDGVLCTEVVDRWYNHLKTFYTFKEEWKHLLYKKPIEPLPYDLTKIFVLPKTRTGYEFWDDLYLYDEQSSVTHGASEVLERLHKEGNDILIVSRVIGCHEQSKRLWAEHHFPYAEFIATRHKKRINCDYIVDDSIVVLNEMPVGVNCIKFRLDYAFPVQAQRTMKVVYNFEEIYKYIQTRGEDWT